MIRLTGVEGKLFVLDLVSDMEGTISLTGGISKDVDENICTLEELKYIETSFKTKRVSMSEGDFTKLYECLYNTILLARAKSRIMVFLRILLRNLGKSFLPKKIRWNEIRNLGLQ